MSAEGIRGIKEYWEKHARRDPLWAILSDPSKKGRKWGLAEFFETGRREVSILLYRLETLHIPFPRGTALDFGCGIGRLTQALAPFFDSVAGVDISETMIRLAERLNRFPKNVAYHINAEPHLRLFPDRLFDFIYTNIVLQHVPPNLALAYLAEFLRILRPDGLLIFQLPSHKRDREALPPSIGPMSDEAYASRIRVEGMPDYPLPPSSELVLKVFIKNSSPIDWIWSEATPIRLGNHWLTQEGALMLIQDDGRTTLPTVLPAGEECLVYLTVKTPGRPGNYLCQVDLVQESVSWFKDTGAAVVQFAVKVGESEGEPPGLGASSPGALSPGLSGSDPRDPFDFGDLPSEEPDGRSEPGDFPMNGIPKDIVVDFLKSHSAAVLRVEEDEHGGREWVGYRYFAKKTVS